MQAYLVTVLYICAAGAICYILSRDSRTARRGSRRGSRPVKRRPHNGRVAINPHYYDPRHPRHPR